jgi:DNA-binding GntR family transcriptional regulator
MFVSKVYWRTSEFLRTIADHLREGEMRREPILAAESAANDEERARLGLFPGEMVYRVDRIRGHGEQLLVEDLRLPAALCPSLQTPVPRISDLGDTYGLELGEALERVCAVPASADIAKALGVAEGTLLLTLDRVVHLRDGRPAEWLRITYSSGLEKLARLIAKLGT